MLQSKADKIVDNAFYEELQIPNKMQYIQKVIKSCKTEEQYLNAYKWGKKCINSIANLYYDNIHNKYGTVNAFIISSKLEKKIRPVLSELRETSYNLPNSVKAKSVREL